MLVNAQFGHVLNLAMPLLLTLFRYLSEKISIKLGDKSETVVFVI